MLNFMQINEKNIEKPLCKNIDIFELPKLMQFLLKYCIFLAPFIIFFKVGKTIIIS